MASNGYQPGGAGIPAFPEGDALAIGADLEELARFAAFRGNALRGTTADRDAFAFPVVGLLWSNTTTGELEKYTTGGWEPVYRPTVDQFVRTTPSDAAVSSGTYIGLVEGTIADARPGRYRLLARASLYASAGAPVVGRVYAEWQTEGAPSPSRVEARSDLPNVGSYPTSPTVEAFPLHAGGDLRVAVGYRRDSGTFAVTGQGSGETVITAIYLGPA